MTFPFVASTQALIFCQLLSLLFSSHLANLSSLDIHAWQHVESSHISAFSCFLFNILYTVYVLATIACAYNTSIS